MYDGAKLLRGGVKLDVVMLLIQGCMPQVQRKMMNLADWSGQQQSHASHATRQRRPMSTGTPNKRIVDMAVAREASSRVDLTGTLNTPTITEAVDGDLHMAAMIQTNAYAPSLLPNVTSDVRVVAGVIAPDSYSPMHPPSPPIHSDSADKSNHVARSAGDPLVSLDSQPSPLVMSRGATILPPVPICAPTCRDKFTQALSSCKHAVPVGVFVDTESDANVDKHFVIPHLKCVRLLSAWEQDTRIAPGLHFHLTPAGHIRLAAGEPVDQAMISCVLGRDRTLAGETLVLVLPTSELYRNDIKVSVVACVRACCNRLTDMRSPHQVESLYASWLMWIPCLWWQAQWALFKTGGHSDPTKLRCPCYTDPTAMHIGKGHKHVFNAVDILPQETLNEVAACHFIFIWDILVLNWSSLRHDGLLQHFTGGSDVAQSRCLSARQRLDAILQTQPWIHEIKHTEGWQPSDDLLDRITQSLGSCILDTRSRLHCANYYTSATQRSDLRNAAYQPAGPQATSAALEPVVMSLYVTGHGATVRLNSILREMGIPTENIMRCMLYCKLAIMK